MTDLAARFHALHRSGCFVIPNPWDAGSAHLLEQLGFKALATTSSGFAWTIARRDTHVTVEQVLAHLRAISAVVTIPVSADFENGYAIEPDAVAKNVTAAAATGIAGLSIEDSTRDGGDPLFDFALAVERIRAARSAIDATGTNLVLTARSEGFLAGQPDLDKTIARLNAYAEAGADCLYAPGIRNVDDIRTLVAAVAPKSVNVLVTSDFTTVDEMASIGVRRISVGGALARAAWGGFLAAAREIAEKGTFTGLAHAVPSADFDRRFE